MPCSCMSRLRISADGIRRSRASAVAKEPPSGGGLHAGNTSQPRDNLFAPPRIFLLHLRHAILRAESASAAAYCTNVDQPWLDCWNTTNMGLESTTKLRLIDGIDAIRSSSLSKLVVCVKEIVVIN